MIRLRPADRLTTKRDGQLRQRRSERPGRWSARKFAPARVEAARPEAVFRPVRTLGQTAPKSPSPLDSAAADALAAIDGVPRDGATIDSVPVPDAPPPAPPEPPALPALPGPAAGPASTAVRSADSARRARQVGWAMVLGAVAAGAVQAKAGRSGLRQPGRRRTIR